MIHAGIRTALALALTLLSLSPQAPAKASETAEAGEQFWAGRFEEAGKLYAAAVAQDASNVEAVVGLGRVALLANRLDEAQRWFEQALALTPDTEDVKVMLAEALYRSDDFQQAAAALNGVDVAASRLVTEQYSALNVAKLKSFKGQTPYELEGVGDETRLAFDNDKPLPIVGVRINGGEEVTFFIDTGGSEVTLDTEFAKELGLPQFGEMQGTFSGGQHASVGHTRIETLGVGDWTVKNVPALTLALRQLSEGLGVKQIDGIIGTTLFYHFLTTLDYPRGELVLRRKSAEVREAFLQSSAEDIAVPIWMASDHFMIGWGRIESLPPTLLFVDTGLAGAGVKLAEPVIRQAGIKLEEDKASFGSGGGGALKVVPYTVRRLSFGDAVQSDVHGLNDGPFPWETMFGFNLAGMVGHDFFRHYAMTFDFEGMRIHLRK